jgi:hypothetical protein
MHVNVGSSRQAFPESKRGKDLYIRQTSREQTMYVDSPSARNFDAANKSRLSAAWAGSTESARPAGTTR